MFDAALTPFVLVREADPSGVSGTGVVADGIVWIDGWVSLKWRNSPSPVPAAFPSIDALLAVHGHSGQTTVHYWRGEDGDDR